MRWAKIILPLAAIICTGTLLVNGMGSGADNYAERNFGAYGNREEDGGTDSAYAEAEAGPDDSAYAEAEAETEAAVGAADAGSADGGSDRNGIMDEYRSFLGMNDIPWTAGERVSTAGLMFRTEDLNGDGIPELLVKSPVDIYGTIGIYSCKKDGICDICYGNAVGWYYADTGVFVTVTQVSKNGSLVKEEEAYYYLEDISQRTEPIAGWSLNIGVHTFYHDGREDQYMWCGVYDDDNKEAYAEATWAYISKEEFDGKLTEMVGNAPRTELSGEWIDNTEENRNKYLK